MNQRTLQLEKLPSGFGSYIRSLAAMAAFVREAAKNYEIKLFTNRLFRRAGIAGHDFQAEISTLFFSPVTACVIRAIQLTLNLYKTRGGQLKRHRATATTRLRYLLPCWRLRASVRGLLSAVIRRTNRRMFGLKRILIGLANGCRLTLQAKPPRRVGIKISLINTLTKFGRTNPTKELAYA